MSCNIFTGSGIRLWTSLGDCSVYQPSPRFLSRQAGAESAVLRASPQHTGKPLGAAPALQPTYHLDSLIGPIVLPGTQVSSAHEQPFEKLALLPPQELAHSLVLCYSCAVFQELPDTSKYLLSNMLCPRIQYQYR